MIMELFLGKQVNLKSLEGSKVAAEVVTLTCMGWL